MKALIVAAGLGLALLSAGPVQAQVHFTYGHGSVYVNPYTGQTVVMHTQVTVVYPSVPPVPPYNPYAPAWRYVPPRSPVLPYPVDDYGPPPPRTIPVSYTPPNHGYSPPRYDPRWDFQAGLVPRR